MRHIWIWMNTPFSWGINWLNFHYIGSKVQQFTLNGYIGWFSITMLTIQYLRLCLLLFRGSATVLMQWLCAGLVPLSCTHQIKVRGFVSHPVLFRSCSDFCHISLFKKTIYRLNNNKLIFLICETCKLACENWLKILQFSINMWA